VNNDGSRPTKTVYERKHILNNVSGCIKPGEFTAILGPSGMILFFYFKGGLASNMVFIFVE